jgi:purine-cytosine permease-like protein
VAKPIAMYMVLVTVLVIATQRVGYKQIAIVELIAIVHITVIIITVTVLVVTVTVTVHVRVFQLVQRY